MKRYDAELGGWGDLKIIERPNGDWVKWDDVQELLEALKEEIERLKTLNSILEEEMSDIETSYRSYMVDGHDRYKTLDVMEQKVYLKGLVMQMMISVDCAKVRKERFLTTGENPKFEDTVNDILNNIEGTK